MIVFTFFSKHNKKNECYSNNYSLTEKININIFLELLTNNEKNSNLLQELKFFISGDLLSENLKTQIFEFIKNSEINSLYTLSPEIFEYFSIEKLKKENKENKELEELQKKLLTRHEENMY